MKKLLLIGAATLMVSNSTFAGGILTNTNQNAAYLRNPARDAVIAIDGVYSNPAGIAFLPQGFHLSLSWQAAIQKRQLNASNPLFQMNANNQKADRYFEGKSLAPVIPSFQAAYVINDKWSVSAQFAVGGGGGKCEFEEGLPMFEEFIGGTIAGTGADYALKQNLTGEQYFYGFQVGGTYKVADNLSVFGGVRGVLANCSYTGAVTNMAAYVEGNAVAPSTYFTGLKDKAAAGAQQAAAAAAQYEALGMATEAAQYAAKAKELQEAAVSAGTAAVLMGQDLVLDCSQSGFGITPIIGLDWKLGKLNLAAKYEFRTKINLESESKNSENLEALTKANDDLKAFGNGAKTRSDIPAILTLGAMYEFTDAVRVMGGFHYYWDKDAKGTPIKEGDNTWEWTLGAEWDVNDKIMLSLGSQQTNYGFADSDMKDTNFNINSTAICVGGAYKFTQNIKLNVGYMHSFYTDHKFTRTETGTACNYTRKNDVLGMSLDIKF